MKLHGATQFTLGLFAALLSAAGLLCLIGLAQVAPPTNQTNRELLKEKILAEANASTLPEQKTQESIMKNPSAIHVPILTYHYIRTVTNKKDVLGIGLSVPPESFAEQMKYLADHKYNTITPDDLFAAIEHRKDLPSNPILLTFDDGHRDFYTNAFPIISKYQLHATILVVPNFLEKEEYLTQAQLKELAKSPLVTIAAHTMNHPDLPRLSKKQQTKEIVDSKKWLENFTGKTISYFAYPYGNITNDIIDIVKKAGFLMAFSTHGGTWHDTSTLLRLHRLSIFGTIDMQTFIRRVGL